MRTKATNDKKGKTFDPRLMVMWIIIILVLGTMAYVYMHPPQGSQPISESPYVDSGDPFGFRFGFGALFLVFGTILLQFFFGVVGDWFADQRRKRDDRQRQKEREAERQNERRST